MRPHGSVTGPSGPVKRVGYGQIPMLDCIESYSVAVLAISDEIATLGGRLYSLSIHLGTKFDLILSRDNFVYRCDTLSKVRFILSIGRQRNNALSHFQQ